MLACARPHPVSRARARETLGRVTAARVNAEGGGEQPTPRGWRSARAAGVLLAIVVGLGLAAQSRVNGALAAALGDSMLAAVVSFGGGLVLLLTALAVSRRMRNGLGGVRAALRSGRLRPWQCLGGLGGAMFVLGQSLAVGVLGVALFTVGVVAGQTVSGLVVDRAGLGPSGREAPSVPRLLGAVLAVVGAGWASAGAVGDVDGASMLLLALPLVAGAAMAVQQAVNGHVGVVAASPFTASLVNFTVGTTALALGWLVALLVRGGPTGAPENPLLYLGGLIGIFVIALAAYIVKLTGVLLFGLAMISGQLLGSMLLDAVVPVAGKHLSLATVIGCVIALVAVTVTSLPRPRPATGPGSPVRE